MTKRAVKAKRAARPSAAKKSGTKARKPAAKTAVTATAKVTPYTPAPLKSDGWAPFRYPLR